MTTKLPGIVKSSVNGYELRKDGAWWMVCHYPKGKFYIEDQFKSKSEAAEYAESLPLGIKE